MFKDKHLESRKVDVKVIHLVIETGKTVVLSLSARVTGDELNGC